MQINNSSDKANSLYHDAIYWLTGSRNSSTAILPIEDFIANANFALDDFVRQYFQVGGRWQYDDPNHVDGDGNPTLPIATLDLVANKPSYSIADEHLRISRLRIIDKNGNWKTLHPVDRRDLNDDQLGETGEPDSYDKLGPALLMYPLADYGAGGGVELTFERGSNYFTTSDTTKVPGIASPFHRYISLYSARAQAIAKPLASKLQTLDAELKLMKLDLQNFLAYQDRDEKPRMTLKPTMEIY
jgi:hypothetical protein